MNIFLLSLRLLLPEVLAILQTFVKNPTSLANEINILIPIRDALNGIIAANQPPAA